MVNLTKKSDRQDSWARDDQFFGLKTLYLTNYYLVKISPVRITNCLLDWPPSFLKKQKQQRFRNSVIKYLSILAIMFYSIHKLDYNAITVTELSGMTIKIVQLLEHQIWYYWKFLTNHIYNMKQLHEHQIW